VGRHFKEAVLLISVVWVVAL